MHIDCVERFIYLFYLSNFDFVKRYDSEPNSAFVITCLDGIDAHRVDDGLAWYNMSTIVGFFKTMGFLLDELERNGLMLLKIDIEKIYWVNHNGATILFYTDFRDIMTISEGVREGGKEMIIMSAFKKTVFMHKSMHEIKQIPAPIKYDVIYHNLGYIVYWLLFRDADFDISKISELNGKDGEASDLCVRLKYSLNRCIKERLFIWI